MASKSDSPRSNDFWKAEATNGRRPMGQGIAPVKNASAQRGYATPRPRGGANPDTNITGPVGIRKGDGKVGATYRVVASLPAQAQEVSSVQANGKILPPTHSRSGSFYVQGVYDSQAR